METQFDVVFLSVPPNVVGDFDVDLVGPQSVLVKWLAPSDGAPVDGYKVTYWGRPGSTKTLELPHDVRPGNNHVA